MVNQIAVVIPHYQHTAGVLARTLAAVFAQDIREPVEVIVVDDESPVPAANELAALDQAARASIRIIERRNGGPAAARNTGLAALSSGTEIVALLDCDDLWQPQHLARAMRAFDLGHDFYFANHRRERSPQSSFSQCGIRVEEHRLIDPVLDLYRWQGDLFDISLRHTLVGLSTVVYRRAVFPDIRLNEAVGLADDVYFALEVARATDRIAFSPSEDVLYTEADNASVVADWRSNKSLRLILSLSLCYSRALKDFAMTDAQRMLLRQRLREFRLNFATTVAAMSASGIRVDAAHVARFLRHDPALLGAFPVVVLNYILKRTLERGSRF